MTPRKKLGPAPGGMVSEVGKRRANWRSKWGRGWVRNSRWQHGRCKCGEGRHHRHWDELRGRWRKAHGAPPRRADRKPPTALNQPLAPNPTPAERPNVPPQGTGDKDGGEPPRRPTRGKGDGSVTPPPAPPGRNE